MYSHYHWKASGKKKGKLYNAESLSKAEIGNRFENFKVENHKITFSPFTLGRKVYEVQNSKCKNFSLYFKEKQIQICSLKSEMVQNDMTDSQDHFLSTTDSF